MQAWARGHDERWAGLEGRLDEVAAKLERIAATEPSAPIDRAARPDASHEIGLLRRELRVALSAAMLPAASLWRGLPTGSDAAPPKGPVFPNSTLCRQVDFETPWFAWWARQLDEPLRYHRKLWEYVFICQALDERGALTPGARGLGFAVGMEPLSAYLAGRSCLVTATDQAEAAALVAGWTETREHAASIAALRRPSLCSDEMFSSNVQFSVCDMNDVPDTLNNFDFCWSACALEHLGSIERGLSFVEQSLSALRPGGLAVHTTEFNLTSNDETVDHQSTVLFRRRDFEALVTRLSAKGHHVAPLDLSPGYGLVDGYLDLPPYRSEPHLKLMLEGFATTSAGLIIRKADTPLAHVALSA